MAKLTVKPGDVLVFCGCNFNPGWEFDAPWIIYEPVQRWGFTGSLGAKAMEGPFEDLMIDLCTEPKGVERRFSAADLDEFSWRGWSPKRFAYRRSAFHAEQEVRFYLDGGALHADVGPIREIPARGVIKLSPKDASQSHHRGALAKDQAGSMVE